jgi:ubiquinone/menaquinone biosynthesis C-methylase UbiE
VFGIGSNQEKVIGYYLGYKEDSRATESSSAAGLEFHYTKKLLMEYITPESHMIELGCATGYYGMFFSNKCAEYTGIDLSPDNIAVFDEKITSEKKSNIKAFVGDATNLPEFSDDSFDVVLCLGPMYHLPREERLKVFCECKRIARTDGILAFAYINGIGAYIGACISDSSGAYPNSRANKHVFELGTDDIMTGVFFFTSPSEMEYDAAKNNLKVLKNCGVNFTFAEKAVNAMSEEQFASYIEISDKMCASPSCTELSAHALLVCRK